MTWDDIITEVRLNLQETVAAHWTDNELKRLGCKCQRELSILVPEMFRTTRSFSTAASTKAYSLDTYLGKDFHAIDRVTYADDDLVKSDHRGWSLPAQTGTPTEWDLVGNNLWLEDTPGSVGTIVAYGSRITPDHVLGIKYTGVGTATVAVTATQITLTGAGGAASGALLFATYATLTTMAAAINAVSGYTATIEGVAGSEASAQLEVVSAQALSSAYVWLYYNPELRTNAINILEYGMTFYAFARDDEDDKSAKWGAKYEAEKKKFKSDFEQLQLGGDMGITDVYGMADGDGLLIIHGGVVAV